MAQQESISRKVIAGVIIGIILAALGFLAKSLLPGLLGLAATFLLTVWRWCVHLVSVPVWLLIVLSLYVATSFIRACLRHRRNRIRQKNAPRAETSAAGPNWQDYRCDVFSEIVWRWEYDSRGQLVQVVPFCLKCDTQIHPQIGDIGPLGKKTNYRCDHCGNYVLLKGSHDGVVDQVSRQIQRKLRSASEEWKAAIKTQGWLKR